MEQLFAVRVLIHYYDKPKVDHAAVRRLLSAAQVDSLQLLTAEGTTLTLLDHMNKEKDHRKVVSEVLGSYGSALVQVAAVFMLAEARAAADAIGTNPSDLETACSALERLLGSVATQRPFLPMRDIRQSAKVRLGSAARRRALDRLSNSSSAHSSHVSILKAVNAILRLCDVATHCMSVVSRQSPMRKSACETAVNLSTRLLTLAASLYEVQRIAAAPALSFFSSNSLRTALVTGAMHLGSIIIEHSELEPMAWIHVANQILIKSSTPAPHRTSLLSALFGGMIRAGKRYQSSERDSRAAEGAVCLLSTLHVALEADTMESYGRGLEEQTLPQKGHPKPSGTSTNPLSAMNTAPVSHAARSFLGERVIAAEEDGDEGRIAARTAYQACEEYAERAGETNGMIEFLVELFSSAAKQCRQECSEEPVVSISEGTLPCPPDESDASSDVPQARTEAHQFASDIFENRLRDGLCTGPTGGSNSEMSIEQIERIELHREIGALALECLAHWLDRTSGDQRYTGLDIKQLGIRVCCSASWFMMSNSPASYNLKSAMVDFGALIGPILKQGIEGRPEEARKVEWNELVLNLVDACSRTNPVLAGILAPAASDEVLNPLLDAFLSSREGSNQSDEPTSDEISHLPVESILEILLSAMHQKNAMCVVEKVSRHLRDSSYSELTPVSLMYFTSCLILFSHAVNTVLGIQEANRQTRLALAALFHRDVDFVLDPVLPDGSIEDRQEQLAHVPRTVDSAQTAMLVSSAMHIPDTIGRICAHSSILLGKNPSVLNGKTNELLYADYPSGSNSTEKLCYHFFWSCMMVEDVMRVIKASSRSDSCLSIEGDDPLSGLPLSGPYLCLRAYSTISFRHQLLAALNRKEERSFALLYVAECTALLQCESEVRTDADILETLLVVMVSSVTDLLSKSFYKELPKDFRTLHDAFLGDPLLEMDRPRNEDSAARRKSFQDRLRVGIEGSCLTLAMHYMRSIALGNAPDLLADAIISVTNLLHYLGHEKLLRVQKCILQIANHILFLPTSLGRLRGAMCGLLERFLSLVLKLPADVICDGNKVTAFICRVYGFSYLLERTQYSSQEIQAICKFAFDTASNERIDKDALTKCTGSSFTYEHEEAEIRHFLSHSVPTPSLSTLLERILVPRDESAVAVSSHSHSLSYLTKACEASSLWKSCVIRGLGQSLTTDDTGVVSLMIRRSVMQSATMNEAVLSVFEDIVGASDSELADRILTIAFRATKAQLEEDLDTTLESRIRLLNFAVRATVSHGYVKARINGGDIGEGDFLGAELIDMFFSVLHITTEKVLHGAKDRVSEQMILFLCSLMDCVQKSLFNKGDSFFDHVADIAHQESVSEKSEDRRGSEDGSKSEELQSMPSPNAESLSKEQEENPSHSTLCTYTSTGSQFVKQHWYFCYSCEFAESEGVCSVCARVCHEGCELAYSKFSRFFCDCGAGSDQRQEATSQAAASSEDGEAQNASGSEARSTQLTPGQVKSRRPCLCLNSKKDDESDEWTTEDENHVDRKLSSYQNDREKLIGIQLRELLSSVLEKIKTGEHPQQKQQRDAIEKALKSHLSSDSTTCDLTSAALFLTREIGGYHIAKESRGTWKPLISFSGEVDRKRRGSSTGKLITGASIGTVTKVLKASSYEIGSQSPKTQGLQGSLIAFSPHENIVAVANKTGCVNFVSSMSLLSRSPSSEKKASLTFRRVRVAHAICNIQFHPGNSNILLVVGPENVSVLCRLSEGGGSRWQDVEIEIGLSEYEGSDGNNTLVHASWVNEKSTLLLVLTEQFIKIFEVAVDTFCPCFFSKIPGDHTQLCPSSPPNSTDSTEKKDSTPKVVLTGSVVLLDDLYQAGISEFYVLLLTSHGDVLISRSRRNDAKQPVFSHCFSLRDVFGGAVGPFSIHAVCYSYARLMLLVTSSDGSMASASVALRERKSEMQFNLLGFQVFDDVLSSGAVPVLEHVPGSESTFLFYQRGQSLASAGVLTIKQQDSCLEVQSFSGTPSAAVVGLASFGPTFRAKGGSRGGGFLVLDDGSLHRVDLRGEGRQPASKPAESASLLSILERQKLRAGKFANKQKRERSEYDPIPATIGFFEKCRIVTDHVTTEILDPDLTTGSPQATLTTMTSEGRGDRLLSLRPNEPFRFTLSIENSSLVLVGARLLFGGKERSRSRIPGTVKIFDRTVHWKSVNGLQRWLDIPLKVSESTASPQKVSFELIPKRFQDEADPNVDGLVGFDCFELYAVSSIEFTERKLLHEKGKEKFLETLRDKGTPNEHHTQRRHSDQGDLELRRASSIAKDVNFSEDQAGLLAVMSAIDAEEFSSSERSSELFLELNNQWSSIFEDRFLGKQPFLEQVHSIVSCICFREMTEEGDRGSLGADSSEIDFISTGIDNMLRTHDGFFKNGDGIPPNILTIEKLLFAIGGVSRALLHVATEISPKDRAHWIRIYESVLPTDSDLLRLLQMFLSVTRPERLQWKSTYGAAVNAVDIVMARVVKRSLLRAQEDTQEDKQEDLQEGEEEGVLEGSHEGGRESAQESAQEHAQKTAQKDAREDEQGDEHVDGYSNKDDFLKFLAEMLFSLDQDHRLEAGERILNFYDWIGNSTELLGSPFELNLAESMINRIRKQGSASESLPKEPEENANTSEGSDGTQRWAYRCDSCEKVCDREWWHCNDCEDFDLCTECLRSKAVYHDSAHNGNHVLLWRCADDDQDPQTIPPENKGELCSITLAVQETLEPLANAILAHMESDVHPERTWRYVDAFELFAQLLSPTTPESLREPRTRALFRSNFLEAVKSRVTELHSKMESVQLHQETTASGLSRECNILALMLRVLLSAPNTSIPSYLHQHDLPATLLGLLRAMHPKLRALVRHLNAGKPIESTNEVKCDLMARNVWKKSASDITYVLMTQRRSTGHSDSLPNMFETSSGSEPSTTAFVRVMIEVIQVLDYSFKSAASEAIAIQMENIPQNILCDFINFHGSVSGKDLVAAFKRAASAAKRLLTTLSLDDANTLNYILDQYLYEEQTGRLADTLGRVTREQNKSYDLAVELASIVNTLYKAASTHSDTWRSYVIANKGVLRSVYKAVKVTEGHMQVRSLQLFAAVVATSPEVAVRVIKSLPITEWKEPNSSKVEKGAHELKLKNDRVSEGTLKPRFPGNLMNEYQLNQQVSTDVFSQDDFEIVQFLVQNVLLRSQLQETRAAAGQIIMLLLIKGATETEGDGLTQALQKSLHLGIDSMPYLGDLADSFVDCLRFLVNCCHEKIFGDSNESMLEGLTLRISSLLKQRCRLLISHPNARLYGRLSEVIDVSGYYLESDPCLTCAASTWESAEGQERRLDTVRAETKYTATSIMHRLVSIYSVTSITVKIIEPRKTRRAKKIDVLYSSKTVADAAQLKSSDHPWKKLTSLEIDASGNECTANLIIPVALANIKLAFTEFHDLSELPPSGSDASDQSAASPVASSNRHGTISRSTEPLHCPRCSRSVTDRHGICRVCHENAYQCRQCRNINYENLDGFLCNECGYCKHGRFEFYIIGRPTFVAEPIENEQDRKKASKIIEKETTSVHRCIEQLVRFRSSIIRSLVSGIPMENGKDKGKLFSTNRVGLADLVVDIVAPRSEIAVLEAILEGQASGQEIEEATNSTQGGVSITEEVIAEGNGTIEVSERDQGNKSGSAGTSPTNRMGGAESQPKGQQAESSIIVPNISVLAATYARECRAIFATMSRSLRVLMLTRAALVCYANVVGGLRKPSASKPTSDKLEREASVIQEEGTASSTANNAKKLLSIGSGCCYGCTQSFISKAVNLLQTVLKCGNSTQVVLHGADLAKDMMLICALCHKQEVRNDVRDLITYLVNDNMRATQLICSELSRKIGFCIDSYETIDSHSVARFEVNILEAISILDDSCWEERLKLVIRILFKASHRALTCSSVAESIILPCLKIALHLLRADAGLTVISDSAPVVGCGGGIEASKIGESGSGNNNELETESIAHGSTEVHKGATNSTIQVARSRELSSREANAEGGRGEFPLLQSTSEDILPMPEVERQAGPMQRNGARMHNDAGKDLGFPDRKQNPGIGSSQLSGSGAPSSIGTAFDTHVSDDETILAAGVDCGIDMTEMAELLENEHDAKRVTASVRDWLDGRQTQSDWIANMTGKLLEAPEGLKQTEARRISEDNEKVRQCFTQWRELQRSGETGGLGSVGALVTTSNNKDRLLIQRDNWIVRLMLFTPCADVRREACALLNQLCGEEEMVQLHLLDLLTGSALELGAEVGEKSREFFDLLENALTPKTHRLYVMMRDFLPKLAVLIQSRAEELVRCEEEVEASVQLVNFSGGYSLKRLVSLLRLLLDAIPSQQSYLRQRLLERENGTLVSALQRSYICVRKLISMRTRLTDDSGTQLSEILLSPEFLFNGSTVSAVVSACVTELKSTNQRNDAQSVAILLDELCLMLCPERQEPTCSLLLQKTPTQEEFIRGSMSRSAYLSSSFDGPLMRDVKNKICKDLDLPGLLEDDFAMELLVAGNLVKLDLPIMGVYEHVWRGSAAASVASSMPPAQISRAFGLRRGSQPSAPRGGNGTSRSAGLRATILSLRGLNAGRETQENETKTEEQLDPPMIVVYRLSGLDGEATEPIVDSLPKESGTETDGEEQYKETVVFGEVGGLNVLLDLLAVVGSWGDDADTAIRAPALRLLRCSCEVAKNRDLLSKSPGAVGTLLDCAALAFEHAEGSRTAVTSAESLLIAAERILAQQRKEMDTKVPITSNAMGMSSHDPNEVMARVKVFLGRLALTTSSTAEDSILHLLPFLVQGIPEAIDLVLTHLRFSKDDLDENETEQRKVHQLGTVLLATPRDLSGNELAVKTIQSGIYEDAVSYVTKRFPVPRREHKAVWEVSLQSQAPPLLLRVLTGLSSFLHPSQHQLSAGSILRDNLGRRSELIPILCQLEMAVSANSVGTSAEELLDALSRDKDIESQIEKERRAIRLARRKAAQASRAAILKEVGLSPIRETPITPVQSDGDRSKETPHIEGESVQALVAELPDEDGPSCVVCGDGFRCRPEEALALYVYSRKVSLDISLNLAVRQDGAEGLAPDPRQPPGRSDWEAAWSARRGRGGSSHSKSGANSCFTTVTHMNAIHLSCHKEAARVDRSSRRDEWEGASLRNSQTKCNNMFPLRPPAALEAPKGDENASITKLAKSSYVTAVDGYFARLTSLGRTSLSQAKIAMYDLGRSLLRFADGGTAIFSEYSQGGGSHSNACLLPYLVQLLIYLIECSATSQEEDPFTNNTVLQTQEAALAKFLFEDEPGDVTYYLASSVVLQDLNDWEKSLTKFLDRGMMERTVPIPILLRMVAFVDAVQRCLKEGLAKSDCHWLASLREHVGMDVTLPSAFGDRINEKWENYLRTIDCSNDFIDAIKRNMGADISQCREKDALLSAIKQHFDTANSTS